MKSLNCPRGVLAFVLIFSKLLSCPWMLCVIDMFWLTQELWVILDGLKKCDIRWSFGSCDMNQPGDRNQPCAQSIYQSCLHNGTLIKTLGTEAWVNYSGCQYYEHIVTHQCKEEQCVLTPGREVSVKTLWDLICKSLTLAYLNLYPFLAMNFSSGCNSFHWLLWVYLVS